MKSSVFIVETVQMLTDFRSHFFHAFLEHFRRCPNVSAEIGNNSCVCGEINCILKNAVIQSKKDGIIDI